MNKIRRAALAVAAVFLMGIFLEFLLTQPARSAAAGHGTPGGYEEALELSEASGVTFAGFTGSGSTGSGGGYTLSDEYGRIHVPLDGRYITAFYYDYEYDGLPNVWVRVGKRNVYGETRDKENDHFFDRSMTVLRRSVVPVYGRADWAEISVSRSDLREAGLSYIDFDSMPLTITGCGVMVIPKPSWYRLFFFWIAGAVLAALLLFRDFFAGRIERGFLLIALGMGLLLTLSLPVNKVGWDEEVHFEQAFWMSNYRSPVDVTDPVMREFEAGLYTWPYNQPGSDAEQDMLEDYLSREALYAGGAHHWSTDLNKMTMTGYAGQALLLRAGQALRLPFPALFRLGRIGNLLVYVLVMFLAIRITPAGKPALAFLALMPEPMLLAGVYSYDPTVNAFLALAFAMILREVAGGNASRGKAPSSGTMTWRRYLLILAVFCWGCLIKAVYAPLLLLGLLIPEERYRDKRQCRIMRAGFVLAVLALMLSFVLPVVLAPRDIGDVRGNATSEKGQMAYILGQPLAYARILFANMLRTLPSYVLGEQSLGQLGNGNAAAFPWVFYAGSVVAMLLPDGEGAELSAPAGGRGAADQELSSPSEGRGAAVWNARRRCFALLLIGAAAVLVWTSMYIAFTTPGNTYIEGVQGRYYLPFLWLLWMALSPARARIEMPRVSAAWWALLTAGAILGAVWYVDVYGKFCR